MHAPPAHRAASLRSERGLRWLVLAPPLMVLALLCALAMGSLQMLGAARAYVAGESLWSKSRGSAVQALEDYMDRLLKSGDSCGARIRVTATGMP